MENFFTDELFNESRKKPFSFRFRNGSISSPAALKMLSSLACIKNNTNQNPLNTNEYNIVFVPKYPSLPHEKLKQRNELNDISHQISKPSKKECSCRKTKCLQMYCPCFAQQKCCNLSCSCVECHNSNEYEDERISALSTFISHNTNASRKIKGSSISCNCKKSNCSRRYCDCYASGLSCSSTCKCSDCKNKLPRENDEKLSSKSPFPPIKGEISSISVSSLPLVKSELMVAAKSSKSDQLDNNPNLHTRKKQKNEFRRMKPLTLVRSNSSSRTNLVLTREKCDKKNPNNTQIQPVLRLHITSEQQFDSSPPLKPFVNSEQSNSILPLTQPLSEDTLPIIQNNTHFTKKNIESSPPIVFNLENSNSQSNISVINSQNYENEISVHVPSSSQLSYNDNISQEDNSWMNQLSQTHDKTYNDKT